MDWHDTPEQAQWRNEVRTFIRENLPSEVRTSGDRFSEKLEQGSSGLDQWRAALQQRGWVAPAWPKEYGGAEMDVVSQFILNEEFAEAAAPHPDTGGLIGPSLIVYGTPEQKARFLPRMLAGKMRWCQGFSEPGAGSDLASLQTRAVRDGDTFIINGQKIWTSFAHYSDWCHLLVRTNPDAPKHHGITYLMLDLKSPGVTIRPLLNMADEHRFNEVFFEDVRVPVDQAIGEVNRGWYVATTTLDFERSSISTAVEHKLMINRSLDWMRSHAPGTPDESAIEAERRKVLRTEWADRWVEASVAKQLGNRIVWMQASGRPPNAEASAAKVFNTELSQRISRTTLKMLGMWGPVLDASAPFGGHAPIDYMMQIRMTIAGGSSEIQRNIVATRGLGLPRA
jgi:alkylation response protein AidB-like acyl-CoA dehydrogenase